MKPTEFLREFNEKDSGEYNDEAGMAQSNLETIVRSAQELEKHIGQEENLPEWCQEKLAVVKGMLTAVTDYMVSQDALDAKQDDFAFNTDRIAEQLDSMLEGGPYDLPGIDYDRPGDTPRKPKSHGGSIPRRHDDEPDFMDPDQRRLRADQARVKKAQDEYHAKKKSGMAEGEIEKTPTGIIHRAEKRQASRAPEMDRLDKGTTNNLDKGIGVHWDKTPGRGRHGIIDPTVDEQGVAEAAPSTELQDKMRQVRPKGKGITRTELQNAMRRKGKKQWHCPECATYDDNVHGKFCSKYKPKEQGVAEGYEPPTSAKGSPAYRASLLRKKQERQAAADAKKKQQGVAEGHADQQRKVFKKNGEPVGEVGIDRESSPGNGQWYMKCYANGIDNVGYDSYEEAVAELKHCLKQGVAEAVWDRPSQSYVPRDGRTFGQTNHPREEHCDACGAATGHAGPGEDSNVDDEGNVYCDDCYADQKGVAEDRLDELSPKTLGSYINKATKDAGTLGYGLGDINARPGKYKDSPDVVKDVKHSFNNRIKGVEKASHRLTKEQGVAEGHADQQRKIFKKNGHPVGEVGIDRESSPGNGQWYMKYYATGDDFSGYDSMEEAVADLKHLVNQFKAEGVAEEWSQKYKKSINCSHPRGFSQKAHCAGKKKHNESAELDNVCPDCGFSEQGLLEAKKGLYYYVNKRKKAGTSRPANHPKAPTAQAWKDAAKTAKKESMDYESQVDALLNEFAGGMGAASVATAPGVGKGPKVGTLFGGSYTPKTPFNKKRKR